MASLSVSPNPAAPSTVVAVTGSGFLNFKTRLLLDGAGASTNIFRPRKDGTFAVGITVSGTAKTQTLVAQQNTSGNTWAEVARTTITVAVVPPPVQGPTITAGPTVAAVTDTGASVGWSLSAPCTGQVEYGPTTAYGLLSTPEPNLYTTHLQQLTGLTAGTTYHFRVHSKNASGQEVISPDATFATAATVPPVVVPPVTPPPGVRRFALPVTTAMLTVPSSIDASGASDVTDALTNWVNAQPNGSRIWLPAGAGYKMTGHGVLLRDGAQHLIIESDPANPATILTYGADIHSSAFVLGWGQGNCSHLTFRNLKHKNDNPDGASPKAYHLGQESSEFLAMYHVESYIEVDNVHATDLWGHGIYVGTNGNPAETADHIWVHDSLIERTGLYGVVMAKVDTAWVERNTFVDIGGSPLGFEDGQSGEAIRHVYYGHNILTRWAWTSALGTPHAIVGDGASGMTWDDVIVDSNRLTTGVAYLGGQYAHDGAGLISFWGTDTHTHIQVIGNTSDVPQIGDAVRVLNAPGVIITGNALQPSSGRTALRAGDTTGAVVTGNTPNP